MREILKEKLIPLYEELLNGITLKEKLCTFCVQWGDKFPIEKNEGVLFVGKAPNGWTTTSRNINVLFGDSKSKIFAREDQMEWVHRLEGDVKNNTRTSAFLRVMKQITKSISEEGLWYSKIAWSNLYKVSFEKGNPNAKLKKEQLKLCKKILESEINILSPKYVIFLSSGWENEFLYYLNNSTSNKSVCKVQWGNNYETKGYLISGRIYITSQHPQGKKEKEHIDAILKIIKNLN